MNEEEARENEEVEKLPPPPVVDDAEQQEKSMNETVFLVKLPEYTTKVQQWMEETKPYLRKDFKIDGCGRGASVEPDLSFTDIQ